MIPLYGKLNSRKTTQTILKIQNLYMLIHNLLRY